MANQSSSCSAVAFTSAALSCASQLPSVLYLYRASGDGITPLALNAMLMLKNVVCCAPAQRPESSQVSICQLSLAATEPDLRQRLTCGCCLTSVPSPKLCFIQRLSHQIKAAVFISKQDNRLLHCGAMQHCPFPQP